MCDNVKLKYIFTEEQNDSIDERAERLVHKSFPFAQSSEEHVYSVDEFKIGFDNFLTELMKIGHSAKFVWVGKEDAPYFDYEGPVEIDVAEIYIATTGGLWFYFSVKMEVDLNRVMNLFNHPRFVPRGEALDI